MPYVMSLVFDFYRFSIFDQYHKRHKIAP